MRPLPGQAPPLSAIPDAGTGSLPATSKAVETINVHVHEVNLVLSVTDQKGRFVNNLQPSDLRVVDNDVEQTQLTFFKRETDLPIKIAMVLDISSSIAHMIGNEIGATRTFLRKVARPLDSVALVPFNQNVNVIIPVANNWSETKQLVKRMHPGGETALFDAVSTASEWLAVDHGPARHIMILISDGQENGSKKSISTAISAALNADAIIYSVNVAGENYTEDARQGAVTLRHLAEATGGTYLEYSDNGSITHAFDKIRRELRSQYSLAYKLSNPGVRTFHRLQVLIGDRRHVHCRSGYYVR